MKKIRINELARECEQPNGVIIAILDAVRRYRERDAFQLD